MVFLNEDVLIGRIINFCIVSLLLVWLLLLMMFRVGIGMISFLVLEIFWIWWYNGMFFVLVLV